MNPYVPATSLRGLCDTLDRSGGYVARQLDEMGFNRINLLANGLWQDEGYIRAMRMLNEHPEYKDHFAIVAGWLYFGNSDVEMYFKLASR